MTYIRIHFDLAGQGERFKGIADILSEEKILIPSAYSLSKGRPDCHCNSYHDPYRWNSTTISSFPLERKERTKEK